MYYILCSHIYFFFNIKYEKIYQKRAKVDTTFFIFLLGSEISLRNHSNFIVLISFGALFWPPTQKSKVPH